MHRVSKHTGAVSASSSPLPYGDVVPRGTRLVGYSPRGETAAPRRLRNLNSSVFRASPRTEVTVSNTVVSQGRSAECKARFPTVASMQP